jgi:hypothetical protein
MMLKFHESLARVRLLTYEAYINSISNRDFIKIICFVLCLLKQVICVLRR